MRVLPNDADGVINARLKPWHELAIGSEMFLNVTDDPYGAVGDGVTDDSSAFAAAISAAQEAASSSATQTCLVGNVCIVVPPGEYLIKSPSTLLSTMYSTKTAGLSIRGAGRSISRIRYEPDTPGGYLAYNNNAWLFLDFSDLTFYSDNAANGFLYSYSSGGGAQNNCFDRVNWEGQWADVIRLEGDNNNSEMSWRHCGCYGTVDNFLHVPAYPDGSDQFVDYDFFACNFAVDSGDFIHMEQGGCVNVWGGYFVHYGDDGGTFFKFPTGSAAYGVPRLLVSGPHIETWGKNSLLCDIAWNYGTVEFISVETSTMAIAAYGNIATGSDEITNVANASRYFTIGDKIRNSLQGIPAGSTVTDVSGTTITISANATETWTQAPLFNDSTIRAKFTAATLPGASIKFEGCHLNGLHQYTDVIGGYAYPHMATYDSCVFENATTPNDFIVRVHYSSHTNYGSLTPVTFRNCHATEAPDEIWETTLGGTTAAVNAGVKKYVSLKTAYGTSPDAAYFGYADMTAKLPLGSYITRLVMALPAGSLTSGTSSTFHFDTDEASPTTLATVTAVLSAGFYEDTPLCWPCKDDDTRTIHLVCENADQMSDDALFLIEYV